MQSSLKPKVGTYVGDSGGENMTWKTINAKGTLASEAVFFCCCCRHKYINTKADFLYKDI